MKLLDSVRDLFAKKLTCYECEKTVPETHAHRVTINFHGELEHHHVCDDCYRKVKTIAKPKVRTPGAA